MLFGQHTDNLIHLELNLKTPSHQALGETHTPGSRGNPHTKLSLPTLRERVIICIHNTMNPSRYIGSSPAFANNSPHNANKENLAVTSPAKKDYQQIKSPLNRIPLNSNSPAINSTPAIGTPNLNQAVATPNLNPSLGSPALALRSPMFNSGRSPVIKTQSPLREVAPNPDSSMSKYINITDAIESRLDSGDADDDGDLEQQFLANHGNYDEPTAAFSDPRIYTEQQLTELKTGYLEMIKQNNDKHTEEINNLRQENLSLKAANSGLQQTVDQSKLDLSIAEERNKRCEYDFNSLKKKLLIGQKHLQEATNTINKQAQQVEGLTKSINDYYQKVEVLEKSNETLNKESNRLNDKLNEQASENSTLKSEIDALNSEIVKNTETTDSLRREIADLQDANKKVLNENQRLMNENNDLRNTNSNTKEVQEQLTKALNENDQLVKQNEDLTSNARQLLNESSQLENELQLLQKNLNESYQKQKELSHKLDEVQGSRKESDELNSQLKSKNEEQEAKIKTLQEFVNIHRETNEELIKRFNLLKAQTNYFKTEAQVRGKTISEQQVQIKEMKKLEIENSNLIDQIKIIEGRDQFYEKEISRLEEKIASIS